MNGKLIEDKVSPLTYVTNKRLQEWIEPKGSWPGFFKALRTSSGEKQVEIEFTGTFSDFEDLAYAKDKFGGCFDEIKLIHKNKNTAKDADPYQKMLKLKELYQQLQDGPIEEFKTEDIQQNFDTAINSDFRIVIVAPMSSGMIANGEELSETEEEDLEKLVKRFNRSTRILPKYASLNSTDRDKLIVDAEKHAEAGKEGL